MKAIKQQTLQILIFLVLIAGLSVIYNYPETLMKRPQSVHNWRQCDGASLALNYYQEGMHFFRPQTHMLYSDGFTSGYSAPSEIPILYYFLAILYHIFGYHEVIFRAVNLLIFYIGMFYLFRLSFHLLRNVFYASVVVALIFSSPLLVYYANNFMPNTVALSFSFIGWYYFFRHVGDKKTKTFLVSILFFGIAGAMKITELTGPAIIMALVTADKLKLLRLNLNEDGHYGKKIIAFVSIVAVVAGWVLYAKYYNARHGSWQFSTFTFPIWEMTREDIAFTLHKMNVLWFKEYFYPPTFWFMITCLALIIGFRRFSNDMLRLISVFFVLALISFSLLWFQALGDHDYFYIGFYVLPAFLFINFFLLLSRFSFSKLQTRVIQLVFLVVVAVNVIHARDQHTKRYIVDWRNDYEQVKDMYTAGSWLEKAGITKDDSIVFYPSQYIRPLYLMNLKGWVIADRKEAGEKIAKNDSLQMRTFVDNGASYFITIDLKSAAAHKPFLPYMTDIYGKYNNLFVFRIPARAGNFCPTDTVQINNLINISQ